MKKKIKISQQETVTNVAFKLPNSRTGLSCQWGF